MSLTYRTRQFALALTARVRPADEAFVRAWLPTLALQALFFSMGPAMQAHHIAVARDLLAGGERDPDLVAAALLHDVGKGRLSVSYRVALVVLKQAAPGLLRRWAARPYRDWRGPLYQAWHHPRLGAERAAAAGASARTVDWIARHQGDPGDDALLRRLQAVDDDN